MKLNALTSAVALGVITMTQLVGCGGETLKVELVDSTSSSSETTETDTTADSTADTTTEDSAEETTTETSTNESLTSLQRVLANEDETSAANCESDTDIATLVCSVNVFLATLSEEQQASILYNWSDSTAKTTWSNLPGVTRNGLKFGDLNDEQLTAAFNVLKAALSEEGYKDFFGTLAADDYIGTYDASSTTTTTDTTATDTAATDMGTPPEGFTGTPPEGFDSGTAPTGAGPMGGSDTYVSDNFSIAFIGNPAADDVWMLQFGGHHMAYNITYLYGEGYPTPHHLGAEPKVSFQVHEETYSTLVDESEKLQAMYAAMSDAEFSYAYLSGQSFSDVLMGPDNGSGVMPTDYPTSEGILVSDLNADAQAKVKEVMLAWINDYSEDVAAPLEAAYLSVEALAQTYVAWAGDESIGIDIDTDGTYMRIDGPRFWLEIICQNGVVIQNETHYHTIFRDKAMDYGNSL